MGNRIEGNLSSFLYSDPVHVVKLYKNPLPGTKAVALHCYPEHDVLFLRRFGLLCLVTLQL